MKHLKEFNEFINEGVVTTVIASVAGFFALKYAIKKVLGYVISNKIKLPPEKLKDMIDIGMIKGFDEFIKSNPDDSPEEIKKKKKGLENLKKHFYKKIDDDTINTINDVKVELNYLLKKAGSNIKLD